MTIIYESGLDADEKITLSNTEGAENRHFFGIGASPTLINESGLDADEKHALDIIDHIQQTVWMMMNDLHSM